MSSSESKFGVVVGVSSEWTEHVEEGHKVSLGIFGCTRSYCALYKIICINLYINYKYVYLETKNIKTNK